MAKKFANFQSALQFYGLIKNNLPNPDTVLRKKGMSIGIYRELKSDAQISANMRSRKTPVLASEWTMEKRNTPSRVFKVLSAWQERAGDCLESFLDIIFWGYMPVELVWKMADGLWLPTPVPKPPEWFTYYIDANGEPELRFISHSNPVHGEPPPNRFTLLCPAINRTYDNPYGQGVASLCFWPVFFKKAGLEFWLNFAERFATPWVKGKTEAGMNEDALSAYRAKLEDLVQDAVIVVTGQDDVQIMAEGGNSGTAVIYERLCQFMNNEISKAVLSQTLTTEVADKGALATAKVHSGVRDDITDADLKTVQKLYQEIICLIMERNGYSRYQAPIIKPYEEEDIQAELAVRDEKLAATMQKCGYMLTGDYFKRKYRLEDNDFRESSPVPEKPEQPVEPEFSEADNGLADLIRHQTEIDTLAQTAAEQSTESLNELTEEIMESLKNAGSYEEAISRAMAGFPHMTMGNIRDILAKAIFAARLQGMVSQ